MPYKLNKIIFQRDRTWGCETYSYTLNTEIDFPYAAGMLQELTPKEPFPTKNYKPEISDLPLFNEKGLGKLIPEVGPKGIYYLELRPGYKLEKLYVEPDELIIDIYYGGHAVIDKSSSHKSLIYSFYNPTRRKYISITAAIEKDDQKVYSKLKSDPKDIYWRQHFVRLAMEKIDSEKSKSKLSEYMTVDEVAKLLKLSKKTIRNWTSEGKIPSVKLGSAVRYRKTQIDNWSAAKEKKSKRKRATH
jgi:excisionase family DNA binding protein